MRQFDLLYPCNVLIKETAQKLREINDQMLQKYGLNTSQGMLLGVINYAVETQVDINRKYLETAMKLSGPSVTNLLNGLERNGFITRGNRATDGRNLSIGVTPKTLQLIDDMAGIFAKSEQLLTDCMSDAEKTLFLSLLTRAYRNVAEHFAK